MQMKKLMNVKDDANKMPYIIQMLIEIAGFLSLTEYLTFGRK